MKPSESREYTKIRLALKNAETLNARNERSVPLYRLREQLHVRQVTEDTFKTYLYKYVPKSQHDYIEAVSKRLYHCAEDEISRDERFLITSGLC